MKRMPAVLFAIALLLSASAIVKGQELLPELAKVEKALECVHLTGWKRERVPPVRESADVLIEMYYAEGRRVKVSITHHQSELEASKAIQKFVTDEHARKIQDLGDEAYLWSYSDEIAMRKGRLTVFVSAGSDIGSLLPMIEESERYALTRTEVALLNKNFARIINTTLSKLTDVCRPPGRPDLY